MPVDPLLKSIHTIIKSSSLFITGYHASPCITPCIYAGPRSVNVDRFPLVGRITSGTCSPDTHEKILGYIAEHDLAFEFAVLGVQGDYFLYFLLIRLS
jgi:hypothetical protein